MKIPFEEAKEGDELVSDGGNVRLTIRGRGQDNVVLDTGGFCERADKWQALGFHIEREEPEWVECSAGNGGDELHAGGRAWSQCGVSEQWREMKIANDILQSEQDDGTFARCDYFGFWRKWRILKDSKVREVRLVGKAWADAHKVGEDWQDECVECQLRRHINETFPKAIGTKVEVLIRSLREGV